MANTYKDIVITPSRGDANSDPIIKFSAGDASTNSDMNVRFYATSNGTLSFEGSAGQLFSITNDLSGTLFSVNDISGIPSIEIDANGKITMATFGGNVGVGTSNPIYKFDVAGTANISNSLIVAGLNVQNAFVAGNTYAGTMANAANAYANSRFLANTAGTFSGSLNISGDLVVTGNTTLGDASTDTITINGNSISLGNNQNIDSGTLFVDGTNNRVGIGNTNPLNKLVVDDNAQNDYVISIINRNNGGFYRGGIMSLFPNLNNGQNGAIFYGGKDVTTYNGFGINYNHVGAGSLQNYVSFNFNGSDNILTFTASRFAGIGTNTASANLHVIGNTIISSALTVATLNIVPAITFAFAQANAGTIIASSAYDKANAANVLAQSAYDIGTGASTTSSSAFDKANSAESIAIAAYQNSNTKLDTTGGTITGDLAIAGNLIISGNTTYVSANTLTVTDPLIYLAANNYISDLVDIGFIANYVNATGANVHTGLYREHENKMYYLFQGYDQEPINNHIGALSNNMTLAVLNADLVTSNLRLGGTNAIVRFSNVETVASAAYDKANNALANSTGTFAGDLTVTGNVIVNGNQGVTVRGSDVGLYYDSISAGAFELTHSNDATGNYFRLETTDGASQLRITTAGNNIIMLPGQNLGVGTTTPAVKLDVDGAANVSSALTVSGMNVVPTIQAAFNKANSANVLAFNTGAGANAYASGIGANANLFASATIAGANTAVGTGANAFATSATVAANNYAGVMANAANNFANGRFFANATGTFAGDLTLAGTVFVNNTIGLGGSSEGGQIELANSSSPTQSLSGRIVIDVYENRLRFFEKDSPNRGAFIEFPATSGGAGTNLLASASGTDTTARAAAGAAFDKANAANVLAFNALPNTDGAVFNGTLTASANLQADKFISTNNGNGENYKVGDDAWIGDTNLADTVRLKGQQNVNNGYIMFGQNDGTLLGRSGSGPLTFGGSTVWTAGNDGAASGLDADLLDGQHGAFYGTAADVTAAFDKANSANLLAFNTGIGANVFAAGVGSNANLFASGVGSNANLFASATIAGANTAVGNAANNYAGIMANAANSFMISTVSGANTAVGTAANNYAGVMANASNAFASAVGVAANTVGSAAFAKANANNGIGNSTSGQVLFNDAGISNGNSALTFNKTTGTLNVSNINITGTASYISANSITIGDSEVNSVILITSTTSDQIIDSFANTAWRSTHYHVTMNAGTDYQTTQISVLHDGLNAYMTEYATIVNANNLGVFSATVTSGNIRLNIAPTFAATTIRMFRTANK